MKEIKLGLNESQEKVFKLIYNRPKTREEIASSLDLAVKTVDNTLPIIKRALEKETQYVFIKNYDRDRNPIYSVTEKKELMVKIKPKVYTYFRSQEFPYIIINLPPPPKNKDKWIIIPLGDTHYGSDSCDMNGLLEWIKWIESQDNVLVILNGDLIENANKDSPGASVYRQLFPPEEQRDRFIKLCAPIAHRILYSVRGNHGNRSVKQCFLDPERDISNILEVEYFEGACYADIICEDNKWEFMSIHGNGNSATPGGKLNLLQKKNQFHSADIYTMGHVHDLQAARDYEIVRDTKNMKLSLRKRYYVICGTTQKYWNSYAEEWYLPPNKTGMPKIMLYTSKSEKPGDYHVTT